MSNIVPPLLSNSPPPMVGELDEEDDDEFGDFAVATDLSYGCDALSLPSSPRKSPRKGLNESISNHDVDVNCSQITNVDTTKNVEKDFQDRRKVNVPNSEESIVESGVMETVDTNLNLTYNNSKIKTNSDSKYNGFQYFPEMPPDILPENEDEFADDQFNEFENFQDFETSKIGDVNCKEPVDDINVPEMNCTDHVVHDKINQVVDCTSDLDEKIVNSSKIEAPCIPIKNDSLEASSDTHVMNGEIPKDMEIRNDPPESSTLNIGLNNTADHPVKDDGSFKEVLDTELNLGTPIEGTSDDEFGDFENHSFKSAEEEKLDDVQIAIQQNAVDLPETEEIQEASVAETQHTENMGETHVDETIDIRHKKMEEIDVQQTKEIEVEDMNDVEETKEVQKSEIKAVEFDLSGLSDNVEDDFGDFEASVSELKSTEDPFQENKASVGDVSEINFGNFDSTFEVPNMDFGAPSDFSLCENVSKSKNTLDDEEDEFGDFNDYSVQTQVSQTDTEQTEDASRAFCVDIEDIPQKANTIILEMFPEMEQNGEEYQQQDFIADNNIFNLLKDVTETCALQYQWSKSNSQHCLLQALNIDTRNILYGPRWNESMPRYAATLGYTPLEPVKSEMLTPTSAEPSTSASPSQTPSTDLAQQTDIPSAQFDWVGSGLTNPLEMTPKKVIEKPEPQHKNYKINEQIAAKISTKTSEVVTKPASFDFAPPFIQPDINTNLQHDSESVKSLQLHDELPTEEITKCEINADFDDFTSFQSSQTEENENFSKWSFSNSPVPLRETHISNSNAEVINNNVSNNYGDVLTKTERVASIFEEPGWLKPTILTPDLPRKETVVEETQEEEDEFADFQTSQSVNSTTTVTTVETKTASIPAESKTDIPESSVDEDDEFTDFQSTLPTKPVGESLRVLPLEPLQPSVLQPTVLSSAPAAINWPDPGITDDDLKRIELNYKPHTNSELIPDSSELQETVQAKLKESSGNSLDTVKPAIDEDDDWSDFVSNQGPSEPKVSHLCNKATNQVKQPSRTSTPELQLSVPQLNQIQLPKKPVPIVTQQGLVHNKSLNSSSTVEPLVQPSIQQVSIYPQTTQLQNGFQPSLISNQYAVQFGQGLLNSNYQNSFTSKQKTTQNSLDSTKMHQYFSQPQPPKPPLVPVVTNKLEEPDDEWSDFVSSQPAKQSQPTSSVVPNGLPKNSLPKPNFDWNRPPQFTSWSANVTPNIITNPVSFDTCQSYNPPAHPDLLKNRTSRKNPSMVVQPKKNTVPSISTVPDLEFIAPKNRTWKK